VALFGSFLKQSEYIQNMKWEDLISMIQRCVDYSNSLQKQFLDLVIEAQKIYAPPKKKKILGF